MLTAFNQLCYNTQRQWSSYMQVAVKSGVVKNKASFASKQLLSVICQPLTKSTKYHTFTMKQTLF